MHGAVLTPRKLAKFNVQTSLCDRREPANASSLYLAVLIGQDSCFVFDIVAASQFTLAFAPIRNSVRVEGLQFVCAQNAHRIDQLLSDCYVAVQTVRSDECGGSYGPADVTRPTVFADIVGDQESAPICRQPGGRDGRGRDYRCRESRSRRPAPCRSAARH